MNQFKKTGNAGHHQHATGPRGMASGDVIKDASLGFDDVAIYSINGSNNNPSDPTLGAAGTDEVRIAPANFAGAANTPVGGPNPRVISNTIFANDANANDPGGRSAYMYAFGQFVDHDIDLNMDQVPAGDGSNTLSMTVPAGDPSLPPGSLISIVRGQVDPATGAAINSVTQYLDLSQVYGSDPTVAASLRNADGTLKTSAGNYLPIVDGQYVGGDVRAAENPDLTSLDVLFVREHNRWVAQLHAADPKLSGDQLYDMARAATIAEYQNIVYSEFLPSLLGPNTLTPYQGYNPNVSPQISEEFSTAAYRFGHSIISPTETKIANDGTVLEQQDLVAASSESTASYSTNGGADALLRNLAQDYSQKEGATINSDLRNMLNANPPGDRGDLAAIDILRTRPGHRNAQPDPSGNRPVRLYVVQPDHLQRHPRARTATGLRDGRSGRSVRRGPGREPRTGRHGRPDLPVDHRPAVRESAGRRQELLREPGLRSDDAEPDPEHHFV
jgi:peroxidase